MRNLKLLYFIKALFYSWFWLGTWVLFYRTFGGFAAVGLLEMVMIVTQTVFEIPTGALGDLLGKKKTLLLGIIIAGVSQIWMGVAPNLLHVVLSLIVLNIGYAFISGTFEAMMYDSLKDEGKENLYNKEISKMTSIYLASVAVSGVVGGWMYILWKGLPYVANGVFMLFAAVVALWLTEPKVDTEKFSLLNYLEQNFSGFKQLFKTRAVMIVSIGLLLTSSLLLILSEGVNDMLAVTFGFTEVQLGFIMAAVALLGAGASYWAGYSNDKNMKLWFPVLITLLALSLLVSPWVSALFGAVTLFIRALIAPVLNNQISVTLNENIESKYRATTLSTFSMLENIPYVVSIYLIGHYADIIPLSYIVFGMGVFVLLTGGYNYLVMIRQQ